MSSFIQRIVPSLLVHTALQYWKRVGLLFSPLRVDATLLTRNGAPVPTARSSRGGPLDGRALGLLRLLLLVPIATIVHGIALIPAITAALPQSLRPIATLRQSSRLKNGTDSARWEHRGASLLA